MRRLDAHSLLVRLSNKRFAQELIRSERPIHRHPRRAQEKDAEKNQKQWQPPRDGLRNVGGRQTNQSADRQTSGRKPQRPAAGSKTSRLNLRSHRPFETDHPRILHEVRRSPNHTSPQRRPPPFRGEAALECGGASHRFQTTAPSRNQFSIARREPISFRGEAALECGGAATAFKIVIRAESRQTAKVRAPREARDVRKQPISKRWLAPPHSKALRAKIVAKLLRESPTCVLRRNAQDQGRSNLSRRLVTPPGTAAREPLPRSAPERRRPRRLAWRRHAATSAGPVSDSGRAMLPSCALVTPRRSASATEDRPPSLPVINVCCYADLPAPVIRTLTTP
jgi:hypothetical protein